MAGYAPFVVRTSGKTVLLPKVGPTGTEGRRWSKGAGNTISLQRSEGASTACLDALTSAHIARYVSSKPCRHVVNWAKE